MMTGSKRQVASWIESHFWQVGLHNSTRLPIRISHGSLHVDPYLTVSEGEKDTKDESIQ